MLGVIDVGGGLRDIFGAGIFDWCMEHGVNFDYGIGVSAGSANITSYISRQHGRNISFYADYPQRREYMGWGNFLRHRSFINLQYIYGTLTNEGGENPIIWERFSQDKMPIKIVASNALTGRAHYFDKSDIHHNDFRPIMASCNVPIVDRPFVIDGVPYYDGGICDPVPIDRALSDGCTEFILILTKPRDLIRTSEKDSREAALFLKHKYPKLAAALVNRAVTYNNGVAYAKRLEKEGKCLILAPTDIGNLKTLTIDRDMQMDLYRQGREEAEKIPAFLDRIGFPYQKDADPVLAAQVPVLQSAASRAHH